MAAPNTVPFRSFPYKRGLKNVLLSKSTSRKRRIDRMKELQKIAVGRKEAAAIIGVSDGHLANLASRKLGPKFYKCGAKAIYKLSDLEEWAFAHPVLTVDSLPTEGQ
jgi:hypothetical protein